MKRVLTKTEKEVLQLGLSFCPSSRFDYTQTRIDLFKFIRKLKLLKVHMMHPKKDAKNTNELTVERDNLTGADLEALLTLYSLDDSSPGTRNFDTEEILAILSQLSGISNFRSKSTLFPQTPHDAIDAFNDKELMKLRARDDSWMGQNLTTQQQQALSALERDTQLLIKPSDKGGKVVLLTKEYDEEEALRQLRDSRCYEPIGKEDYTQSICLMTF
ncbi:hypothetical protein NDU88_006627 [Pleurodeles waltl]|uniref:Uncharacterized protein n=1 Tax=Pleurodeles waltl TaxID=8319 RepID=A0AAV7LT48_PLEWA|nr:hypothetical protein NDU88_006627 [Pleurodeles waltl]